MATTSNSVRDASSGNCGVTAEPSSSKASPLVARILREELDLSLHARTGVPLAGNVESFARLAADKAGPSAPPGSSARTPGGTAEQFELHRVNGETKRREVLSRAASVLYSPLHARSVPACSRNRRACCSLLAFGRQIPGRDGRGTDNGVGVGLAAGDGLTIVTQLGAGQVHRIHPGCQPLAACRSRDCL
jgi:hypothetical protein